VFEEDAMRATALTATSFDSAKLSGLASIAHPMREPGHWRLEVHGRRLPIQSLDIIVREGGAPRLVVDFSSPSTDSDCCAAGDRFLAPNGMINLNTGATGQGGFALLFRSDAREPAWDSRQLEPGDLYACMPLRPGTYLVSNQSGDARASVSVNYPDPRAVAQGSRLASGAVHLQVGAAITPGEGRIDPGLVLILTIKTRSHLSLELERADDGPTDLAAWKAARNRDVLEAAFRRSGSRR
jgi:hypothetical protein